MSWHSFAATNKDGSCLWCGRTLRQRYYSDYTRVQGTKAAECKHCHDIRLDADGLCAVCGRYTSNAGTKKLVARKKAHDKPGDYGDGFFCGLRCAYQFAVSIATGGRRLKGIESK